MYVYMYVCMYMYVYIETSHRYCLGQYKYGRLEYNQLALISAIGRVFSSHHDDSHD